MKTGTFCFVLFSCSESWALDSEAKQDLMFQFGQIPLIHRTPQHVGEEGSKHPLLFTNNIKTTP